MTPAEEIAAVAPIATAILPREATPLEKALLSVELAALARVDATVIASIWNPATCPAILLPWLAWALSVDVWDASWTEERKRKVIAASPIVHRLKGTRGAVERALAAFDLETEVVEWWEESGRRGTFRVDMIYRNGGTEFDPLTQLQAYQAVKAAKPKSRVLTVRSVLRARGETFALVLPRQQIVAIAHPFAFESDVKRAVTFLGSTAATLFTSTIHPKA